MVAANILRHPEDWNGQLKRDGTSILFQFLRFRTGNGILVPGSHS